MLPNAFAGWTKAPTGDELSRELGAARVLWDALLSELALPVNEWYSYSVKAGWSVRAKQGKRTIAYCIPCKGAVEVSFALGEKAIAAARQNKLSAAAVKLLDAAPRYAEGAGVRFAIKNKQDLALVKILAAAKIAH